MMDARNLSMRLTTWNHWNQLLKEEKLLTVKNNTLSSTVLASSCFICFFIVILVGKSVISQTPAFISFLLTLTSKKTWQLYIKALNSMQDINYNYANIRKFNYTNQLKILFKM